MRRWRWIVVLALVSTVCGGAEGDTAATPAPTSAPDTVATSAAETVATSPPTTAAPEPAEERLVESGDGLATLLLAPGSLPVGVSADEVALTVVVNETDEAGVPLVGVQLLPDGLVLSELAMLSVALPKALEGGLMALHMSGDFGEFVDGEVLQDEAGAVSFRTPVGHFSTLYLYSRFFIDASLVLSPQEVTRGQTQHAAGTIATPRPVSLWINFASDSRGLWREFSFSAPQEVVLSSWFWWIFGDGFWDKPKYLDVDSTQTEGGWETSVDSICLKPDKRKVQFVTGVNFSLTLLGRGEPTARSDLIRFAESLRGTPAQEMRATARNPRTDLRRMSSGETILAFAVLSEVAKSVCVTTAATTSSTTSTTTSSTTSSTTTTTQASSGGSKSFTGNMNCPLPGKTRMSAMDISIPNDASNPSYSVTNPFECPDTTVTVTGQLITAADGSKTYRIVFSTVAGPDALTPEHQDAVSVTVSWS